MDWTNIIVGLLAMLGTLGGSMAGIRKANALVVYRLEQLEQKVGKHNGIIERTYILEEKMKVANHRIGNLGDERG